MKRIGITVQINKSLFSSGVNMNAMYLSKVLQKCGYVVDLICSDQKTIDEISPYEKEINIFSLEKSHTIRYNLIIQVGFTIDKKNSSKWKLKNKDIKFVAYECGNHYLVNTEKMLFKQDLETSHMRDRFELDQKPHQVWTIPQMEDSNYTFYQFYSGQEKVTVVPFIWEPFIIEKEFEDRGIISYTPRPIEQCSVMEPNISVMKNIVLPIVILEKNQKVNPLKHIYLFGADVLRPSKPFVDFVLSTEIGKNKIVSSENRFRTAKILSEHSDFVFSWQWENNLNYLWLDVAWMGYPIIHNGSMCQDVGYYYKTFDGDMALEKINEVIKTHNENHELYLSKNRDIIKRYTKENQTLVDQYKTLVEDVLNNKFKRKSYNWEENKIY